MRALNLVLAVTTAVTVTVAMRAVGLLLVSALMVVPVATAQLVTRGFRTTHATGDGARPGRRWRRESGRRSVDTAPGATIVLLAIGGFAAATVAAPLRRGCGRRVGPAAGHAAEAEPPEVVLTR